MAVVFESVEAGRRSTGRAICAPCFASVSRFQVERTAAQAERAKENEMEPTFPVLQDLIVPQGFIDLPDGTAKEHALTTLGRMACGEAQVPAARVEEVLTAIRAKEKIMSSGIGGIALAHVRHEAVAKDTIRVGRARHGLEFESLDRKPVYLVFLILLHAGDPHRLLTIISEILAALRPEARRTHVVSSPDATTFVERILATK